MQSDPSNQDQSKTHEEFIPYSARFSKLFPLKVFSVISFFFALYQIVAGFLFTSTHPSFFNISLTLSGFFTLALLGLALNWIRSTTNDGEKETIPFIKKRESLSTLSFLILSVIKLGTSALVLSNFFLQKNYVADYLTANNNSTSFDEFGAPIVTQPESRETFRTLATLFIITEAMLFFYSIYSTMTILKFVQRPRKMHSTFIYVANAVLLGAALSLAFSSSRISNMENYSRLESLFPPWNLKALLGLGSVVAGISLLVWLVNFRKWRIGSFALASIIANIGLLLLVFTSIAYSQTNRIYYRYSSTENMKQLKGRMSYISQEELMKYGCPAKYLPQENCENNMLLTAWEADAQTSENESCFNIKCAGLLGQVYSEKFMQVANWGVLTSVTAILLACSLFYSSIHRRSCSHERRSRKNFTWLALLGTVGVICVLIYGFSPVHNIQEYQQKEAKAWNFDGLQNTNDQYQATKNVGDNESTTDLRASNVPGPETTSAWSHTFGDVLWNAMEWGKLLSGNSATQTGVANPLDSNRLGAPGPHVVNP